MPLFHFIVGTRYTRSQVADRIGLEREKAKGDWLTGYTFQQGAFFIFCNVGAAGRTGHDYSNRFEGERLRWSGKTRSRLDQPQSRQLLSGDHEVYVFFGSDDRDPFEIARPGTGVEQDDGPPIRVLWSFQNDVAPRPTDSPGEIRGQRFGEGSMVQVPVSAYERTPAARRACIEHYGCACQVCGFDFEKSWGEWGKDFIHVHHPQRDFQRRGGLRSGPDQPFDPGLPELPRDVATTTASAVPGRASITHCIENTAL